MKEVSRPRSAQNMVESGPVDTAAGCPRERLARDRCIREQQAGPEAAAEAARKMERWGWTAAAIEAGNNRGAIPWGSPRASHTTPFRSPARLEARGLSWRIPENGRVF